MTTRTTQIHGLLFSLLSMPIMATASFASEGGALRIAQAETASKVNFNIPALSLADALAEWSKQTGLQVLRRDTAGAVELTTRRVTGKYSPAEALDKMLAATGLTYEFINDHTVRIAPLRINAQTISYAGDPKARDRKASGRITLAQNAGAGGVTDAGPAGPPQSGDRGSSGESLQEITVTATRREENISRVPLSITAVTQESMDSRGVRDILDVARFTPGIAVDNAGTNNIAIRGIASSGGAGTTGIYLDDTPIQMRTLAFNPDDALPKSFDIARVEVLRGPQGTLFGAGSEGGTVRYITTPPSLTRTSLYARSELSGTQGGELNYEAGIALGGPLIEDKLGARASVWYRRDGGWIDSIDPVTLATLHRNANRDETTLIKLAGLWAVNDQWTITPSIYYQNQQGHEIGIYWPLYSNPGSNRFVSANPTPQSAPDEFYLPALKIDGDFGAVRLISNTSYYHRRERRGAGYDGTLYNLGFYQAQNSAPVIPLADFLPGTFPLLDGNGIHLPPGATAYRAPASIENGQENITQEIRLQSNDPAAPLVWTTGLFFSSNRQSYHEQIHDPMLDDLFMALTGFSATDYFVDGDGNPLSYDPSFPDASYFLVTNAKDTQYAIFGEATYAITDQLRATLGARYSSTKYTFKSITGGQQLYSATRTGTGDNKENAFTPKVSLAYQIDPGNMVYATYAKGFRPGGANNPLPYAACATDFENFNIPGAPETYSSDSVNSYELGAKDNFNNRVRLASSVYYIRWNSIQQTVIPPICQISFIANLGQAVAWGGDIQAEIALTDRLTIELSAGYTDARYTRDSRFNSGNVTPIVRDGDAIIGQSGQPGSAFTSAVSLEHTFNVLEREWFIRADYEYHGHPKWVGSTQDGVPTPAPYGTGNTLQYDPANYVLRSTSFASLRAGLRLDHWTVSAFVDNLTNTHVVTNYNWTVNPGVAGVGRIERDFTFRPRTIGMTAVYRY